MKLIIRTIIITLCVAALHSCAKEIEQEVETPGDEIVSEGYTLQTFSAISEDTKTSISGGNTVWNEGDQIRVVFSDGSASDPFTLTGGAGTNTAEFTGLVPNGKSAVAAVYPASAYSSVSGTTVRVSVPEEQPGTFAAGNVAVAKVGAENDMSFKNVNSFLVFQLKAGSEVSKVEVSSVDGSALSGTVQVDCSGAAPEAGAVTGPASTVSMTTSGAGTYYMSIVPGSTHSKGLKMTYYTGTPGNYTETGVYYLNRNLTIAGNYMYAFGEVETDKNYYVTVSGAGSHTGMDWANAFSKSEMSKRVTLTDAQSSDASTKAAKIAAIDGATFHMAAGDYDFDGGLGISFNEDDPVSLTLVGGYPSSPSNGAVANPGVNATNITGGNTHACMSLSGKMNVTLDGIGIVNGRVTGQPGAALNCSGSNLSVTMTNCRVSGNVHPGTANNDAGAGLLLNQAGSFTATGVTFSGNSSNHAPALFNKGTDMTLNNCTFDGNTATNWGSAVRIRYGNPECVFNSCTFSNNTATNAHGAVVHNDGTTTFNGCSFSGNSCDKGGAMSLNGGGTVNINGGSFTNNEARLGGAIYTSADESGSSSRTLNIYGNCTFSGNHATGWAGAIHFKSKGALNVSDCTFSGNYSDGDSGVFNSDNADATYSFTRVTFTGNHADGDNGGVMWIEKGEHSFTDCLFTDNYTAAGNGGAVYIKGSGNNTTITNSVFKGNYALTDAKGLGGAIRMDNGSPSLTLNGCTFGGTESGEANYCDVDGGALSLNNGTADIINCNFIGNYAFNDSATRTSPDKGYGGAIDCYGPVDMTISGGIFSGNVAWRGAAVNCSSTGSVSVSEVTFRSNGGSTTRDGGVFRVSRSISFEDCVFGGDEVEEGNEALQGGALYFERADGDPARSISGCTFVNNVGSNSGGAIYSTDAGTASVTGCVFDSNHTSATKGQNNKNGGAVYIQGPGAMKIRNSHFTYNYGSKGGAIQCTKDGSDNRPTLYLNGCSFTGNSIKYGYGTTVNIDYASNFCMNNCAIWWYTYNAKHVDTENMESCWIGIDGISGAALISNCSLMGRPLQNDGGSRASKSALIAVYEGASGKTHLVNNMLTLNQGGTFALGGDGTGDSRTAYVYYTHYSNVTKLDFIDGSTGNTKGFWKEHTRLSADADDEADWDDNDRCWKWIGYYIKDGQAKSYEHISRSVFTGYLNAACPDFVTWLGADIDKDKLGTDRGSSDWWPGAYQEASTPDVLLNVITWNIRSSEMEDTGDHAWSARRGGMAAFINDRQPHIICMQECEEDQRSYLTSNCSGYSAVYDNTSLSWWQQFQGVEHSGEVILYRSSDISVQSSGTFWLVDGAPTSPSRSSDQNSYRSCTWMKCTYLGQKMLVMDVHLSYRTKNNSTPQSDEVIALRQREMGVIKTWIDGHYNPASDGWLLFMGDMNTSHQEAIFDEWKDGTYGYFSRAQCPGGSTGRTYNDWDWENGHVATIDFQFYKGFPSVKSYTIPTETYSDVDYLSDHWPVVAEYRMN